MTEPVDEVVVAWVPRLGPVDEVAAAWVLVPAAEPSLHFFLTIVSRRGGRGRRGR